MSELVIAWNGSGRVGSSSTESCTLNCSAPASHGWAFLKQWISESWEPSTAIFNAQELSGESCPGGQHPFYNGLSRWRPHVSRICKFLDTTSDPLIILFRYKCFERLVPAYVWCLDVFRATAGNYDLIDIDLVKRFFDTLLLKENAPKTLLNQFRVNSSFIQALNNVVTTHFCLKSSFSFFVSRLAARNTMNGFSFVRSARAD